MNNSKNNCTIAKNNAIPNLSKIKMEINGEQFPLKSMTIEDPLNSTYGMGGNDLFCEANFTAMLPLKIGYVLRSSMMKGIMDSSVNIYLPAGLYPKSIIFQDDKTTIIIWNDKSKTVVSCSDKDVFSPESGIAFCYLKKLMGNDSRKFHKFLKSALNIAQFKYKKKSSDDKEDVLQK